MEVPLLPPPLPRMEEAPLILLLETNKLLKDMVDILQQQNNRLKHVEGNQENIPTEITT